MTTARELLQLASGIAIPAIGEAPEAGAIAIAAPVRFCECDEEPTEHELFALKCAACGGRLP